MISSNMSESISGKRGLVVYVDDEPNALKYLQRAIEPDCKVVTYSSAGEALNFLERYNDTIDAIIADDRMPCITGREFLSVVAERWPESPRILTTAYADIDGLCSCINEGRIDRVILKPWDLEELRAIIRGYTQDSPKDRSYLCASLDDNSRSLIRGLYGPIIRAGLVTATLMQASMLKQSQKRNNESLFDSDGSALRAKLIHGELERVGGAIVELAKNIGTSESFGEKRSCQVKECFERALAHLPRDCWGGVVLSLDAPEELYIHADPECIAVILAEMIGNALLAAREAPDAALNITARCKNRKVIIEITDNGLWHKTEIISMIINDLISNPDPRPNIGLTIAAWLLQSNNGFLSFMPLTPRGMKLTLTFPQFLH